MMKKAIVLLLALALVAPGAYLAYTHVEALNISRCLGCIALEPKAEKFEEFWVAYPSSYKNKGIPAHPQWVINESREQVVMLFYWGPSCEPCDRQWENMKKLGMVEGTERDGRMTENYSYVTLFSLNAPFDKNGDSIRIYHRKGGTETPTTVILFERNNTIYWYAFSGEANGEGGRPTVEELGNILEKAREEKYGGVQP